MSKTTTNIHWISNLRALAIFAVIILHTSFEGFYNYGHFSVNKWLTATFFDSSVRFCVPIFLMITGALLLGKREELNVFLRKRFTRIIMPFLFWSFIYFFVFSINDFSKLNFRLLLQFANSMRIGVYYHFWYIYMLIGIYLTIPILSKRKTTRTDLASYSRFPFSEWTAS